VKQLLADTVYTASHLQDTTRSG